MAKTAKNPMKTPILWDPTGKMTLLTPRNWCYGWGFGHGKIDFLDNVSPKIGVIRIRCPKLVAWSII